MGEKVTAVFEAKKTPPKGKGPSRSSTKLTTKGCDLCQCRILASFTKSLSVCLKGKAISTFNPHCSFYLQMFQRMPAARTP